MPQTESKDERLRENRIDGGMGCKTDGLMENEIVVVVESDLMVEPPRNALERVLCQVEPALVQPLGAHQCGVALLF